MFNVIPVVTLYYTIQFSGGVRVVVVAESDGFERGVRPQAVLGRVGTQNVQGCYPSFS